MAEVSSRNAKARKKLFAKFVQCTKNFDFSFTKSELADLIDLMCTKYPLSCTTLAHIVDKSLKCNAAFIKATLEHYTGSDFVINCFACYYLTIIITKINFVTILVECGLQSFYFEDETVILCKNTFIFNLSA